MANFIKFKDLNSDPKKFLETTTSKIIRVAESEASKLTEGVYDSDSDFIIPKIEAIHAGMTRNSTVYPSYALKGDQAKRTGVYSWVEPYPKPVIFNHDHETDATGRVLKAVYSESTTAGRPGIVLYPKITSPDAIKAVKDGRLMTVSIGGEATSAVCSVCHTDIIQEGYCGHMKGEEYDGQVCTWVFDGLTFDEVSWVNVPADSDAMVVEKESSIFEIPNSENKESKKTTESKSPEIEQGLNTKTITEGVETVNEEQMLEIAKMVLKLANEEKEEQAIQAKESETTEEKPVVESEFVKEQEVTVEEQEEKPKEQEDEVQEEETPDVEAPKEDAETQKEIEALTAEKESLQAEVDSLQEQLSTLTKEFKDMILDVLASKAEEELDEETKNATLKELALKYAESKKVVEQKRTVESVKNPMSKSTEKVEVEESKQVTTQDKINFLSQMLNKNKK